MILGGCAWPPTWPDQASSRGEPPASPPRRQRDEFDPKTACDEVVKAHNRIRAEAKMPALAISTKLQAAARRHAKDMAAHDKMTHKGSDGSSRDRPDHRRGISVPSRRREHRGRSLHDRRFDERLDG